MTKTKGKGGLATCPRCGSDSIAVYDTDYPDYEHEIQRVSCRGCDAEWTELWKAVNWEMKE
jgi:transposase-like protein